MIEQTPLSVNLACELMISLLALAVSCATERFCQYYVWPRSPSLWWWIAILVHAFPPHCHLVANFRHFFSHHWLIVFMLTFKPLIAVVQRHRGTGEYSSMPAVDTMLSSSSPMRRTDSRTK